MYDKHFHIESTLNQESLLERFLADCLALSEEIEGDTFNFTYVADTIAALYYYRAYDSLGHFLEENKPYIDSERASWAQYMWNTFDAMTEEERSDLIIESITQINKVLN